MDGSRKAADTSLQIVFLCRSLGVTWKSESFPVPTALSQVPASLSGDPTYREVAISCAQRPNLSYAIEWYIQQNRN